VESSCELGNEPSGSIKCWELPSGCTTYGLSSGTQLHRLSVSEAKSFSGQLQLKRPPQDMRTIHVGLQFWKVFGQFDTSLNALEITSIFIFC
jgi:hypothetical protein